jgi:hypothetical protein
MSEQDLPTIQEITSSDIYQQIDAMNRNYSTFADNIEL